MCRRNAHSLFLYNILCYRRYLCLFTRPPETSFIQPFSEKQISARQALKLFWYPDQFVSGNSIICWLIKTLLSVGIFLNPWYVRASHATAQNWCIAYQINNSINIRPVVDIMENLFFLVVAAILLAVSVYFLISYLKDRKKTKLTFNKRKW